MEQFARELQSENLIGQEVTKEVKETHRLTSTKRAILVLLAVQSKIASEEGDTPFRSLCRLMKKFPVLEDLAEKMMERFGTCRPY